MEPFFSIVIGSHKADPALGANSRSHWGSIRRKQKADKDDAATRINAEFRRMGMSGQTFLTNFGQYSLEKCYPVHVTFKRFYSGRARLWDEDNLYSAYKGFQDGVKVALGVDDRFFKTSVEQIRADENELEIVIEPAWACEGVTA